MNRKFKGIAVAALLSLGASLPGHAQDAAKPTDGTKTEAQVNVPRPSIAPNIAPKTAEPATAPATTEAAPRRHRRHARHHYRRYAYWEPFPVYFARVHRHRVYWNRIPWFFF
jgi:hypothetical protein